MGRGYSDKKLNNTFSHTPGQNKGQVILPPIMPPRSPTITLDQLIDASAYPMERIYGGGGVGAGVGGLTALCPVNPPSPLVR